MSVLASPAWRAQRLPRFWRSGALGTRKVVYGVPRHDLGQEQVDAFRALGVWTMLWKGRTAPDPTAENPERLMCLDTEATFDALEVEQPVEQSCCKVRRDGELHLCPHFRGCGYQRQKAVAQAAQVIVCAHDSLFHMKPDAVGSVGLLVIDEAFWQSGLRGLDGKAVLTQDGLEPGKASVTCYRSRGRIDVAATADLIAARHKLWKALQVTEPGPLSHGLLRSVGLTAEECRNAARLERRRLRDPGLLPGMGPAERRKRIEKVLPPYRPAVGAARPLRDAVAHPGRGAGGRTRRCGRGARQRAHRERLGPRAEAALARAAARRLGRPRSRCCISTPRCARSWFGPTCAIAVREPVASTTPHVRVRQVLGSPTTAKALTPAVHAPERDRKTAAHHLRDLLAYVRLRARELRGTGRGTDLLLVGQKAAIDALRAAGLPSRVDAVHFNGLSGLDRWGGSRGLIVLGRTLPAPITVEALCAALTGQMPAAAAEGPGWWYGTEVRRIRLAGGRTHAVPGEVHADPTAEAIRWSICEAELIQAMGRGRGVNRTGREPLADRPTDRRRAAGHRERARRLVRAPPDPPRPDGGARGGARQRGGHGACFPDLWPTADAARQDRPRSVTNCYYNTNGPIL